MSKSCWRRSDMGNRHWLVALVLLFSLKVNFYDWKSTNNASDLLNLVASYCFLKAICCLSICHEVRESQILRKYQIEDREDYTKHLAVFLVMLLMCFIFYFFCRFHFMLRNLRYGNSTIAKAVVHIHSVQGIKNFRDWFRSCLRVSGSSRHRRVRSVFAKHDCYWNDIPRWLERNFGKFYFPLSISVHQRI